ncbi:MAG TPA: hypothetical protein VI911_09740 [Patescibacteria group bacterium]|nr:hypothetical protein [Patescibacteria group bacterium]
MIPLTDLKDFDHRGFIGLYSTKEGVDEILRFIRSQTELCLADPNAYTPFPVFLADYVRNQFEDDCPKARHAFIRTQAHLEYGEQIDNLKQLVLSTKNPDTYRSALKGLVFGLPTWVANQQDIETALPHMLDTWLLLFNTIITPTYPAMTVRFCIRALHRWHTGHIALRLVANQPIFANFIRNDLFQDERTPYPEINTLRTQLLGTTPNSHAALTLMDTVNNVPNPEALCTLSNRPTAKSNVLEAIFSC